MWSVGKVRGMRQEQTIYGGTVQKELSKVLNILLMLASLNLLEYSSAI